MLLLDLMMPTVSGFDILAHLREHPEMRHVPVIVLTSASDPTTKLRVLELGAADFLEKPVDPSELALRLRNTLAFKAHRDRLAYFDGLTNLPNRKLFNNQLHSALKRVAKRGRLCALLQIEIDRLREVNQTLGHRAGDELLEAVASRLAGSLRQRTGDLGELPASTLFRVGGNEFMAMLPELLHIQDAAAVAQRMIEGLRNPIVIGERDIVVSVNIGVVAAPLDAHNAADLQRCAQAALSAARARGRNQYSFYSDELNVQALARLKLELDLRQAVEREQFIVYFQPKVDIATNRIVGAEALVRWPRGGELVPPSTFIPLAEELALITDIGAQVLRQACVQAVRWREAGLSDCGVAVNVSPRHFDGHRLLDDVTRTLRATGLNPAMLTLEITESLLMEHTEHNLSTLESLKALGVHIALDDFGTGYSSLAYLKRMRIDELKIDQSFVSGLPHDTDSAAIVRAILAMASSLGLTVTAEGVEEQEQLDFLRAHGCEIFQGFICSQPIPADTFFNLLRREAMPTGLEVDDAGTR